MNNSGYEFIKMAWSNEATKSHERLNSIMYKAVLVAIEAQMHFEREDIASIVSECNGYRWIGCDANGKGYGSGLYVESKKYNNASAMQSYEHFSGIKPFIHENKRTVFNDYFSDNKFIYKVTGFNDTKQITLVGYDKKLYPGKWQRSEERRKRKLFKFDNKEWLCFRKTIKIY